MAKRAAHTQNKTQTSFHVSNLLAVKLKPFSDGQFVKECMDILVENICPVKSSQFTNIWLSRRTVVRHIHEMSENISDNLQSHIASFQFVSLALGGCTDASDTAQLDDFICGIGSEFTITEELLSLVPVKGTATGKGLFDAVLKVMVDFNLLKDITTIGAVQLEKYVVYNGDGSLLKSDFIIHQQKLCVRSVKFCDIMDIVIKSINFV